MWTWVSLGLILDACRNNAIVDSCLFTYTDWGTISSLGNIHYSKEAPLASDCKYRSTSREHRSALDEVRDLERSGKFDAIGMIAKLTASGH